MILKFVVNVDKIVIIMACTGDCRHLQLAWKIKIIMQLKIELYHKLDLKTQRTSGHNIAAIVKTNNSCYSSDTL